MTKTKQPQRKKTGISSKILEENRQTIVNLFFDQEAILRFSY